MCLADEKNLMTTSRVESRSRQTRDRKTASFSIMLITQFCKIPETREMKIFEAGVSLGCDGRRSLRS